MTLAVQIEPAGAMEAHADEQDHSCNRKARKDRHDSGDRSRDDKGKTHTIEGPEHELRIGTTRAY